MDIQQYTYQNQQVTYSLHGTEPVFLLDTGTHGDEFEVITCVKQTIAHYKDALPPFLYIPEMSPSAVRQKTRLNAEGLDLNRSFFTNTSSQEAQAIMQFLKDKKFLVNISFHEDPTETAFYLYDSGDMQKSPTLANVRTAITAAGIDLYTGIDDPHDPILGIQFVDGYEVANPTDRSYDGTFWEWLKVSGIAQRCLTPEIPGKLSFTKKQILVQLLFKHLILEYENYTRV